MATPTAPARGDAVWRWLTEPILGNNPTGREYGVNRWRYSSGVFLVYLAYAVGDMIETDSVPQILLGAVLIATFVYLYLIPLPKASFGGERSKQLLVLVGMPACMIVYLALVGRGGTVMGVYISVAWVILLRPITSLPLVAGMFALVTWLPERVPAWDTHGPQWGTSVPVVFTGIAIYGLRTGLKQRILLARAEAEVARLAASQERLRIARDLHDLLGHALTTITVKAELASKLASRDPERAATEMAEVAVLGRQGLADVRATVAGYREVSLVTELAAARQVLDAAGIRAEFPASVEEVPGNLRELFGWVVREGVTNAVRHSGARHLRVTVDDRSIEVVDDGAGPPVSAAEGVAAADGVDAANSTNGANGTNAANGRATSGGPRGGSGLAGLAERVAGAGGRVETGPAPARTATARPAATGPGFRLRVVLPGL